MLRFEHPVNELVAAPPRRAAAGAGALLEALGAEEEDTAKRLLRMIGRG